MKILKKVKKIVSEDQSKNFEKNIQKLLIKTLKISKRFQAIKKKRSAKYE